MAPAVVGFHSCAFLRGGSEEGPEKVRGTLSPTNGSGTSRGNHIVTPARVIGPVSGDRGNLLIGRDLVQKIGQHRGIADIACRDADRADLQCFLIHTEMKLAPQAFL